MKAGRTLVVGRGLRARVRVARCHSAWLAHPDGCDKPRHGPARAAAEHVLHLYMLSRVWAAEFRFLTLPDGLHLSIDEFGPEDTERLYLLGQGVMQRREAWEATPPGFVVTKDLQHIRPKAVADLAAAAVSNAPDSRLDRIEKQLAEAAGRGAAGSSRG